MENCIFNFLFFNNVAILKNNNVTILQFNIETILINIKTILHCLVGSPRTSPKSKKVVGKYKSEFQIR